MSLNVTEFKEKLIPLYADMLKENYRLKNGVRPFCMQWGKCFPAEANKGLLFVGKATNGWVSQSREVDELFGKGKQAIFNRANQMTWVKDRSGNNNGNYNTNRSAFWRVIQKASHKLGYAQNGRYSYLDRTAWSNLYKVSRNKGNPTVKMQQKQFQYCVSILKEEVAFLQPQAVVFFTSGWEKRFLKALNGGQLPKEEQSIIWDSGKGYKSSTYLIDGTRYISSLHPQGKKEAVHVGALKELIKS